MQSGAIAEGRTLYVDLNKNNLTHFSTNFKFEGFFWIFPRATENAVASHMQRVGL